MGTPYRLGGFEFDARARRVSRGGELLPVGARAFDLLMALIERRDRVVGKDELMSVVWPAVVVEENNLTVQISTLRKLLGPGLIATVPGRGYRFTGELEGDADRAAAAVPAASSSAAAEGTVLPRPAGAVDHGARLQDNLPAVLPPLIGRDDDLRALTALVARHRLVTLSGAGGIGKSTLARCLLAGQGLAYAHGGCWVDLAPLTDAARLPATLASALGLALGRGEPQAALADALAPLGLLLVLDNAEQVAEGVAVLVQALLDKAPSLHVLVTSQLPLRLPHEHLYRLGPLALTAPGAPAAEAAACGAVALFTARAQALQRPFVLDERNVGVVAQLCRALDGNPLAIELAAARLPLLGLAGVADALGERLRLLRAVTPGSVQRHQSVRAALAWSCSLLAPREQIAFSRLAVFAAAAELGPLQAVLADDAGSDNDNDSALPDGWAVIDALAELVDRSLVAVTADEPPRYRLLESPRALAREQLDAGGEGQRLRHRHAEVMAALAERQMLPGRADADADDLRTAFAWACTHDTGCALILGAWLARRAKQGSMAEQAVMREALEGLLAQPAAAVAGSRSAWARSWLGLLLCDSHPDAAAAHAAAAAAWFAGHGGDRMAQYVALCHQALAQARADPPSALRALDALLPLQSADWPPTVLATGAGAEAKVAYFAGDAARARAALQRQVALGEVSGSRHHAELANLVMVERSAGNVARALSLGLSLVAQLRGTREERSLHYARLNLAGAAIQSKDWALAGSVITDAWPAVHRFGLYQSWLNRLVEFAQGRARVRDVQRLAHAWLALGTEGQVPIDAADTASMEAALARAQQGTAPEERERLRHEGLALTSDTVLALALSPADD